MPGNVSVPQQFHVRSGHGDALRATSISFGHRVYFVSLL